MGRIEKSYVAVVSFTIGDTEETISPGTNIYFDGHKARIEDGDPISMPRLKSVINAGWLKSTDDVGGVEEVFVPQSAGIQVSPSTPEKSKGKFQTITTSVDEQVVGNFRDRATLRKTASDVSETVIQTASVVGKIKSNNVGREGEVVSRTEVSRNTLSKVRAEIRDIEDVKGEAKTESVMQEGIVFQQEGISKKASGAGNVNKTSEMISTVEDGVIVGSIKNRDQIKVKIEGDVSIAPAPTPIPTSASKESKHRRGRKPKIDETLVVAVKKMCPNFPETWDFYAPLKEKLERIQEFLDDSDIVLAIYMAETGTFQKTLKQNHPEFWD